MAETPKTRNPAEATLPWIVLVVTLLPLQSWWLAWRISNLEQRLNSMSPAKESRL